MSNIELVQAIEANPLLALIVFYAACLDAHPKAIAFIERELGLSVEAAKEQKIGFSDRSLGKELPSSDGQRGRALRKLLKRLGVLKSSGHEALRGCVTRPLFDQSGKVTGIHGSRIDKHGKGPQKITIGGGELVASEETTTNHTNEEAAEARAEEVPESAPERIEERNADFADDADLKNKKMPANGAIYTNADTNEHELIVDDDQIIFQRDDRRYRIRGLEKNNAVGSLKVSLLVARDDLVHLDAIDLVKARSRASFIKATAAELFVDADLIKRDIGQLLLRLETLQQDRIAAAKLPTRRVVEISPQAETQALALLRDPNLLARIVADMTACGMVGEATNKLAGYLAATSRKLRTPLAVVIQSSSSAGKTSLMDAVLNMMPCEETTRFSGMTGQSLFYLDSDEIKHSILAISEDEGIREAAYALKLLQSEGELRQAVTARGKDGRMSTETYHVEGPVQIMLTTTAMDIDEELVNRCLVLTVDETKQQTDAIQTIQRQARTTDADAQHHSAEQLRTLHQNAQRLIRPLRVYNPYAPQLTFRNDKTRTRRDHQKYLTLIDTIALLHQHQRLVHHQGEEESIHVEISDIETANRLAGEILGRSLDELSPQTRNCLLLTQRFVESESNATGVSRHAFRFTRRDLRESIGWSDFQVRMHLNKLVELEYLLVHRGRQGRRFVYELLYQGEGQGGTPFLMGLANPQTFTTPSITRPTSSIQKPTASTARATCERDVSIAT